MQPAGPGRNGREIASLDPLRSEGHKVLLQAVSSFSRRSRISSLEGSWLIAGSGKGCRTVAFQFGLPFVQVVAPKPQFPRHGRGGPLGGLPEPDRLNLELCGESLSFGLGHLP